jgi:hypothetical protein
MARIELIQKVRIEEGSWCLLLGLRPHLSPA